MDDIIQQIKILEEQKKVAKKNNEYDVVKYYQDRINKLYQKLKNI